MISIRLHVGTREVEQPDALEVAFHLAERRSHSIVLALEQAGYPREKAVHWWRQLGSGREASMDVAEALARRHDLIRPEAIQVRASGRLTEAIHYRFADSRTFTDSRRVG